MSGNKRISTNSLGVRLERIATGIHILYEPIDQSAQIIFHAQPFLTDATGSEVVTKVDDPDNITVSMGDLATQTYDAGTDPITGADLSQVSVAGIAQIIRAVYNYEYNAQKGGDSSSTDPYTE